ncbi:MAG: hypothetical protein LBT62_07950, partial [Deltaproteobacteria bacterium]|nr:hypothetical protein [Deltaproteobacteria bacterium]
MASTTGVISGSIKWTGLASGTDFASVVDKLVAIESRTITRQETWKAEWQAKIQAISDLNTRLVSLKLDAQDKDTRSELLSRKSTISNESVMTVVNTSTASLGNYDVVVGSNIAEKYASRSYDSTKTFGVASETLNIQVGSSASNSIAVNVSGMTLSDIANEINTVVAATGDPPTIALKAEVKDVKTEGGVLYQRLVLTATEGGSANRIKVTGSVTDLKLG